MDTPNNCRECKHAADCKSYFGGSMCKHEKEINREAVQKMGIK